MSKSSINVTIIGLLLIILATGIIYIPVFNAGFTNWDDDRQVVDNRDIRELSASNFEQMFSSFYLSLYQPLTTFVYGLCYALFDLNASAFHMLNLFLHLVNCLLVYWLVLLVVKDDKIALLLTALFALHPLQVEAVAWVSALSILLCATFYLAAIICYIRYHNSMYKPKYIYITFMLFIGGLLSKSTAISLPVMLLIFDYFFGRKADRRSLIEKIPFFLMAIIFGIVAMKARNAAGHFTEMGTVYTVIDRISIISYSVLHYCIKILIPVKLSAVYPFPKKIGQWLPYSFTIAPVILAGVVFLIIRYRKRNRYVCFAPLFFIVLIAPVLQFIPYSQQMVADRYTYLAVIGFFLLPGLAVHYLYHHFARIRLPIMAAVICYCVFLSVSSFSRTHVWKNSLTLWDDVLSGYPDYVIALYQRGLAKYQMKDYAGALIDYDKAIDIYPAYIDALNNRAITYIYFKDYEKALNDLDRVIDLDPQSEFFKNRALLKKKTGDLQGAQSDFSRVIMANNSDLDAYRQRGEIKARLQDFEGAITDFRAILSLAPDDGDAAYHLGILLYNTRRYKGAITMLQRSIDLNDTMIPAAWYYTGMSYLALKQPDAACNAFTQSKSLGYKKAIEAMERYCDKH